MVKKHARNSPGRENETKRRTPEPQLPLFPSNQTNQKKKCKRKKIKTYLIRKRKNKGRGVGNM